MSKKVIYKIICSVTGKYYLGSSKNFDKRKKRHIRDLNNKNHHSIILQRACVYGPDEDGPIKTIGDDRKYRAEKRAEKFIDKIRKEEK